MTDMRKLKVAVDGMRLGSGGGLAHLIGILAIDDPSVFGIQEIHVWAHRQLLSAIPDRSWLIKHHPQQAAPSVLKQMIWQATRLADEIRAAGCDILFSADASTLCRFRPMVTFNQNLLPFERSIRPVYGLSKERVRLGIMAALQKRAFQFADGVIFLTQYAQREVQLATGILKNTAIIPHGVDDTFKADHELAKWPEPGERPLRCVYVSPVFEYKHHAALVRAIAQLRQEGFAIELSLIGGIGRARAKAMLDEALRDCDPEGAFVSVIDFLPHSEIVTRIAQSDLFVFASGCETFGIALLEAMALGLPIASSDQSSLPETLQDGGEYFNPEDPQSIATAVKTLILNTERRLALAARARQLADAYSWSRCAEETWRFIATIFDRYQQDKP